MFLTLLFNLIQFEAPPLPSYFNPVVIFLYVVGFIGWIAAAAVAFSRARAYGAAARWFALAGVCFCIYHLQWLVSALAIIQRDFLLAYSMLAFFNLFVIFGAACVIIGLLRLTDIPR